METRKNFVVKMFESSFKANPTLIVRSPGRINLIGEHSDYNDGFVLPIAIDRDVWIAFRPRTDRRVIIRSLDYQEIAEFSLDDLTRGTGWVEYIKGVAWAMQIEGFILHGWEGVLTGEVPRGAGLSSSAAVEIATAHTFAAVSGIRWDAGQMVRLAQKAENQWVGVQCGIMDQMACTVSRAGHALFLDCRSLEFAHILLPSKIKIVVLDTSTRRGLVGSIYNERRMQCKSAALLFGVRALRDVDMITFQSCAAELDPLIRRRARHVISENERVRQVVEAIRRGDVIALGSLFKDSHNSLRDDFEVSNESLNTIVEIAQSDPNCYGARMTGAGFGGCAVALIHAEAAQSFTVSVAEKYQRLTGLTPNIFICKASQGASLIQFA